MSSVSKLHFKVVGCTGWEDDYHPKNMEDQSPFVKGWRSERYCLFPQQVILFLKTTARIRKIQLLCHEYMIASKVELFVGDSPPSSSNQANKLDNIQFTRLGYVSMSDNERNSYKSRELKSVNVDAVGQYVKLVLHTNHINRLNLYSQVSLMAINLLGHSNWRDTAIQPAKSETNPQQASNTGKQPPVQVPAIDDLSFNISQDPDSARLIKQLEIIKQQAIESDHFELAKHIKFAIEEMFKVGQVLCQFEKQKRCAIDREDYDNAKKWKTEKDKLIYQTYHKFSIDQLLQGRLPRVQQSQPVMMEETNTQQHITQDQETIEHVTEHAKQRKPDSSILPPVSTTSIMSASVTQERISKQREYISHRDDIELPRISGREPMNEYPDPESQVSPTKPEALTDVQLNEAAVAVQVWGEETVALVFSKQYQLREQGLNKVLVSMQEVSGHSKMEMIKAICQVLKKGLNDKVMSSFNLSLSIMQELLGPYSEQHRLNEVDLSSILDKTLPLLMSRLADTNVRISTAAITTILELATTDKMKPLLGPQLIRPLVQEKPKGLGQRDSKGVTHSIDSPARSVTWRYAKGRVELLQGFIQIVDLATAQLTVNEVMEFVNSCLQHIHNKVRDTAAQLTVHLYRQYNGEIRDLLPVKASDHIAMKNIFWRSLFDQFDQIDGVQSNQDVIEQAKDRKQKKLQNLKGQLDVLKGLASQGRKQMTMKEIEEALGETSSPAPLSPNDQHDTVVQIDTSAIDRTCPFCNDSRPELETRMEQHYAMDCPMLIQCKHCSQVVEIKNLFSHYLSTDCHYQSEMDKCPTCHEVLTKAQLESHIKASRCTAPQEHFVKCPLCHANVEDNDEAWHNHLMGVNAGCAKNPRRKRPRLRGQIPTNNPLTSPAMAVVPR